MGQIRETIRRMTRFSIGTLLVAIAIAGMVCAVISRHIDRYASQLNVVAKIMHCDTERLNRVPSQGSFAISEPLTSVRTVIPTGWPFQVARFLGRPYRVDVVGLLVSGPDRLADLIAAEELPKLEEVHLRNVAVTPEVIYALSRLSRLKALKFKYTEISEEVLLALKRKLPDTQVSVK